jgi:hypothetical protein|nr:hypothetical protein [Kofleriaceae bacterium]
MIRSRALFVIVVVAGCSSHDSTPAPDAAGTPILPGFTVPPPPANGMQIVLPIVKDLAPGSSHEICTYTNILLDHDIDVREIEAYQARSGHHVALWSSKVADKASPSHECSDADMTNFRFIAAANANMTNTAPGTLQFHIAAGNYLAVQEHFINASDEPVDSQSVLDIDFADPGGHYTNSTGLAFLNSDLSLPPGPNTMDIHCAMANDVEAWFTMPHMHAYGTAFTTTWTHAGQATQLVDMPVGSWDPSYEFMAPATTYDVSAPIEFATGDTVDVHCEWNNTTTDTLKFGNEMCVFFAQTIDTHDLGNLACDGGGWGSF